ncbi:MAG: response regulator transcription factor [Methyloligellaceae bacterium]
MIRLFLADDHEIFLQGLKSLLVQEDDFDVIATNRNGLRAWKSIKEHVPDIAVIDFSMPGMNGLEIMKEINKNKLPTKVILLTMHNNPVLVLEAQAAEVAGFILKETAFENLVSAIKIVRDGGRFIPDNLLEKADLGIELPLSQRERLVLTAVAEGHTSKEIAKLLNIKPKTVETYRSRITEKLGLHTIADMTRYAIRMGLVN